MQDQEPKEEGQMDEVWRCKSLIGGKYQGTQLDGNTIRVNGYIPCLTELYRAYHCSLSTFYHGRSINLATANAETVEIGVLP
jgi:hypothetical protein